MTNKRMNRLKSFLEQQVILELYYSILHEALVVDITSLFKSVNGRDISTDESETSLCFFTYIHLDLFHPHSILKPFESHFNQTCQEYSMGVGLLEMF